MDHTERMALHEQYKSPAVGVLEPVFFKRRKENFWGIGFVMPPQIHGWKPGDPIGKRLRIYVPMTPFGKSPVEDDCVHINDPYYSTDPHSLVCAWEKASNDILSTQALALLVKSISDRLVVLEAEAEASRSTIAQQTAEISRLGAQLSMAKSGSKPSRTRGEDSKTLQEAMA